MSTLHEKYYNLRDEIWRAFEELVQNGCDYQGEFPIVVGEYTLKPNGLRDITTIFSDYHDIPINGIVANPDYTISPKKESDKDLDVLANTVVVKRSVFYQTSMTWIDEEVEVEPDILCLDTLATYVSGGYKCYSN